MPVEVKSKEQTIEETASCSAESKRLPDPYYFLITTSGELLSPTAYCKVKGAVDRSTYIGELEFQALEKIEDWLKDGGGGAIAWVSPPEEGVYLTSKVIVSQVEERDGAKVLFNRAIVLDIDEQRCAKLARDLTNLSANHPLLSSINEIRSNPLILNTPGLGWTYVLEELLPDLNLEVIRTGEDKRRKAEAVHQAQRIYQEMLLKNGRVDTEDLVAVASQTGMMGGYALSCPLVSSRKTAFAMFLENSQWFCKKCPNCNAEIHTVVKPGETCPAGCGAVRKCA